MSYMFYGCSSLTSLNLSNNEIYLIFNTNNVNNINHMLYYCSSLTCLNLSNFNNVKYMNDMFYAFNRIFSSLNHLVLL